MTRQLSQDGFPSAAEVPLWRRLATALANQPQVMFGPSNDTRPTSTSARDFPALLGHSGRLPLIIGDFGPRPHIDMTMGGCETLVTETERCGLSWMGWTFHQQCPPNLILFMGQDRRGVGMPILPSEPSDKVLRGHLSRARAAAVSLYPAARGR